MCCISLPVICSLYKADVYVLSWDNVALEIYKQDYFCVLVFTSTSL